MVMVHIKKRCMVEKMAGGEGMVLVLGWWLKRGGGDGRVRGG